MWLSILGWLSLGLLVLAAAGVGIGLVDMNRQNGADKMGGAMVSVLSGLGGIVGLLLGLIWLIAHAVS